MGHQILPLAEKQLAERSFDLRTSGLWAQHASTAPLCYPCLETEDYCSINRAADGCRQIWGGKILLSEVGFEPTPTEVDCDLNAAP
jgi:hypothetical protein